MKLTIEGEAKEIAAFLKETGKRLEGTQDKEIDFSDFDKSVLLVKQHQIWKRQFEEDCKIREEATKKVLSFAEKLKKPEGLFARLRKWAGWS